MTDVRDAVPERKCLRKQRRAQHRLMRDMNIKCCDEATENVVICNAGLVTGLRRETLENVTKEFAYDCNIVMPPGKSYCFLRFQSSDDALTFSKKVHGRTGLDGLEIPLYVSFVEKIPEIERDIEDDSTRLPPGLRLIENFITAEEEAKLLESLNWSNNDKPSPELKHRRVKHFGYEFRYDTNRVDPKAPIEPIPKEYKFLQEYFKKYGCGEFVYDQLTINRYQPGQGIPPHIDTHSPFEDPILSLSLQSPCTMDFKRGEQRRSLVLPPRSLLIMSGESRYAWTHGICPRHTDIVQTGGGITTRERGERTSFTFRKVREGDCRCIYEEHCDTKGRSIDNSLAPGLESCYVHEVYEQISNHFDETRHRQWPNVAKFIEEIETGGLLLDVGCGNGKYLTERPDIFKVGCDRSSGLASICRNRGFEVFLSDCLALPFKNNSMDAVISIAVIHHLSTVERRRRAIAEMLRVLRPRGRCLIYVWAKDQRKDSENSTYLKFNPPKNQSATSTEVLTMPENGISLPVHSNRTNFLHTDVLVPWKRKGGGDFLRFYHVFEENELSELCSSLSNARTRTIYYDQGNWCIVLEKI